MVVYLGKLRDIAGCGEAQFNGPLDWAGLLAAVPTDVGAQLRLDRVNVACAGRVLADKTALYAHDGDEVALLPPVSGG